MKKLLLSVLISLFNISIFAQPQMTKLFTKSYSELNISSRVTNSGIYGLKNFAVFSGGIILATENGTNIIDFHGNLNSKINKFADKNFVEQEIEFIKTNSKFTPDYSSRSSNFLIYKDGTYFSNDGEKLEFQRVSSSLLKINLTNKSFQETFNFKFKNNLAYAGLIGIDAKGNYFLEIEKFVSQVPLKIKREIWVVNSNGEILSKLEIPTLKYLIFDNEFVINQAGELFHLITEPSGVTLVKWKGLTTKTKEIIRYPKDFNKFIHYDYYTTTKEIQTKVKPSNKIMVSTTRAKVLRTAEEYVEHKYYCTSQNLAPTGTTAPDGDIVRTPSWLRVGWNARIPYKWGGFNTVWGFDHDLAQGEFAGDINTGGVSGYAVGVDCSGYVSRCWGLTYHASTAYMPNITNKYNSWDDLKPGDAVHKVGHVRLFVKHNSDGSLRIVEASGRNWDVSYWSYKPSDLTAYTPRYYVGMTGRYSEKSIRLLQVTKEGNGIKLRWTCDTSNVVGYRIYGSLDGQDWTLLFNQDTVKTDSFFVSNPLEEIFYRVSAVTPSYGELAESNWSNPAGIKLSGEKKYLIVDGFNRDYSYASFQEDGNPFAVTYGLGIGKTGNAFESTRNSEVISGRVKLEDYDAVIWYVGDESTVDETFDSTEQRLIKNYLGNGGNLFVSGSEIGWDLYHKGNESDKAFYTNYFKAIYVADDANTDQAHGTVESPFNGINFYFGQTYTEDYPDVISTANGGELCLVYNNSKGAGVYYAGAFGNSNKTGRIIYFAFGPETTADDSVFFKIIGGVVTYFNGYSKVTESPAIPSDFKIENPYPNPFGEKSSSGISNTTLTFQISNATNVKITAYNVLGQQVAILQNSKMLPGTYRLNFDGRNLSAGVYFIRFSLNQKFITKKVVLLK